jgi:hypothetical protein
LTKIHKGKNTPADINLSSYFGTLKGATRQTKPASAG